MSQTISIHQRENSTIAIVESNEFVISDLMTALDLMADISYNHNCQKMLVYKENICLEFFDLSTCLAGDILQKYTNYRMKIAIVGDFSTAGKSLADFIRECNRGQQVFFVSTSQEAIERLHECA